LPVRRLGSTALEVTPLGLGLAAVGRPAYITLGRATDLGADRSPAAMEARTHRVLDAAYGAGIRYVDAARSYGRAEEFLASWLSSRAIPPGALTIGSKWGYRYTAGWRLDAASQEVKDHSLAAFVRQRAETRALLGPYLGLYQVHSATLETGVLEDRAVLGALAELRAEGVVVGLSVSGPRQADVVRRALDVDIDGTNPFASVQATWNVLEPHAEAALAEAHGRGWGVLVKEVLANGRLTDSAGAPELGVLETVARRHGAQIAQVAFAAALARPWADVVLSGAVDERQVRAGVGALAVALTERDVALLRAAAETSERYWAQRGSLAWH